MSEIKSNPEEFRKLAKNPGESPVVMLNLLKLPDELIREVEVMGDNWEKRLVTERMLRKSHGSKVRSEG